MSTTPTPHASRSNRARTSSHLTILSQRVPNVGCREGEDRVVIYAVILIATTRFDRQPGARTGLEGVENLLRPSARNRGTEDEEGVECDPFDPQRRVPPLDALPLPAPFRLRRLRPGVLPHSHDDHQPYHRHEQVEVLAPADAEPVGVV